MVAVSIVIITKNQSEILTACLNKAKLITDDIVIVDNNQADSATDYQHTSHCTVLKKNMGRLRCQ